MSADDQAKLLKKAGSGFGSQREAGEYLRQEFGVVYTQQGISVLFQRLKIKAKVLRPANVKADVQEQAEYKKTLLVG
ncbi:MAG: winged helix-turn-helix domain-containing protein [Acidobacteriota bacterium]|nr:winged helix-turn-helix domain-containing protein [Acidobacteriota bacterium]